MMTDGLLYVVLVLQAGVATAAGAACVIAYRWSRDVWAPLGVVLGLGILIRAWSGLALFGISFLDLPVLASLHTGDGFWALAPDARAYYDLAATAASGIRPPAGSPSPSFLEALGLWMRMVGEGPASAILFNLLLYVGSCVLLIAAFRPLTHVVLRRGALVSLSAFSFSPVLIMLGSQSLKDVFSAFLVVLATVAAAFLFRASRRPGVLRDLVVIIGGAAIAVYLMAGVRAYYAMFMWAAVALGLAVRLAVAPRRDAIAGLPWAAGALVVLWCAFMWGAGPYYGYYSSLITRTLGVHIPIVSRGADGPAIAPPSEGFNFDAARSSVDALRRGFVHSGGATSLTRREPGDGVASRLAAVATGLGAMFLPVSVLKSLSLVEFSGGRGFLVLTDLDTIFINLALLAVVWVLVSSAAPSRRSLPFLCFTIGLAVVSAVLMAYVVTNYGTLFRLRLLAVVPLWLVPLSLRAAIPVSPALFREEARMAVDHQEHAMQAPGAA